MPAGVTAGPSGGNFSSAGKGFDHALNVVVTVRRFLPFASAEHAIPGKKDSHLNPLSFHEIIGQAQRIVWTLISVGSVIDEEKIIYC